jgi:hypothetical protein
VRAVEIGDPLPSQRQPSFVLSPGKRGGVGQC